MRYGVAVAAVAVATGCRLLLTPVLGYRFPFATLFFAILTAAWFGGLGPGVIALVAGAIASAAFLLPLRHDLALDRSEDLAGLLLYLSVGLGISLLGGSMRAARAHAERNAQQANRSARELKLLNETLEERVAERTALAEQRARQLQRLAVEMMQIEQRERRRLAVLLHDDLQQPLIAAKMQLSVICREAPRQLADKLRRPEDLLGECIDTSRSLATELAPPVLYDAGLAAALQWLARWSETHWGLNVAPEITATTEPENPETSAFLLQAARELLSNVLKHSGTREASLQLSNPSSDQVELAVVDRGAGFDAAALDDDSRDRFGLLNIRERIERLGGRIEIDAGPGAGSCVRLVCSTRS